MPYLLTVRVLIGLDISGLITCPTSVEISATMTVMPTGATTAAVTVVPNASAAEIAAAEKCIFSNFCLVKWLDQDVMMRGGSYEMWKMKMIPNRFANLWRKWPIFISILSIHDLDYFPSSCL